MRNRTVLQLITLVERVFSYRTPVSKWAQGQNQMRHLERVDWFADLLFANEFPPNIVEAVRWQPPQQGALRSIILSLWEHRVGPEGCWFETEAQRNAFMIRVAEAVLARAVAGRAVTFTIVPQSAVAEFVAAMELDGYRYVDGRIVRQDENAFDVEEAASLLEKLYHQVGLGNAQLFGNSLRLIDEHYENQKWGDCIKHARDLAETALTEALKAYAKVKDEQVKPSTLGQAFAIRDKLEQLGFVDSQEKDFLKALYSLLSQQGGHANLSQKENALICRQYALSAVHFVLLRCDQLLPKAT